MDYSSTSIYQKYFGMDGMEDVIRSKCRVLEKIGKLTSLGQILNALLVLVYHGASDSIILHAIESIGENIHTTITIDPGSITSIFAALRNPSSSLEKRQRGGVYFRDEDTSASSVASAVTQQSIPTPDLSLNIPKVSQSSTTLPFRFHKPLLDVIGTFLSNDSPSHVSFPGDKDAYISIPNVNISCPKEYTISMRCTVAKDTSPKGFLLYRSRSNAGGIDVIISDRQQI